MPTPSEIAYAYVTAEGCFAYKTIGKDNQLVYEQTGPIGRLSKFFSTKATLEEKNKGKLKTFEAEPDFIQLSSPQIAINTNVINRIEYGHDNTLNLYEDDKKVFSQAVSKNRGMQILDELVEAGQFVRFPGFDSVINPELVTSGHSFQNGNYELKAGDSTVFTTKASTARMRSIHNDLVKTGVYIECSGYVQCLSKNQIVDVVYNGDKKKLEYCMRNRVTPWESGEMDAPTAKRVMADLASKGIHVSGSPIVPSSAAAPETATANASGGRKKAAPPKSPGSSSAPDEEMKERLRAMPERIKRRVIGQDEAADKTSMALWRAFAGLKEDNKPIGCYVFKGPTGVGKTEAARQTAAALDLPFKKLDMSEYMEKHNVARMIGSPPGYKDSEDGGQLTSFVNENPKCVLLLDEIEKAHPDVFNILLQVMDDARLTDGKGNTIDFSNVLLIMSTNLGTSHQEHNSIGFGTGSNASHDMDKTEQYDEAIKSCFTAEFVNRLDDIIEFRHLKPEDMGAIVDILIGELRERLQKKDTTIDILPEAHKYLAQKGYDPVYGARPLKRVIKKEIENVLANEILFGQLENGGTATVGVAEDATTGQRRLSIAFNEAAIGEGEESDIQPPSPSQRSQAKEAQPA